MRVVVVVWERLRGIEASQYNELTKLLTATIIYTHANDDGTDREGGGKEETKNNS